MARIWLQSAIQCYFNKTQADALADGRNVRWSLADYLDRVSTFYNGGTSPDINFTLTYGASSTGPAIKFLTVPSIWTFVEQGSTTLFIGSGTETDNPNCPLVGGGPNHENSDNTEFASGDASFSLSLFQPYCEQSDWQTATHIWTPFTVSAEATYNLQKICNPSGQDGGSSAMSLPNNIVGVGLNDGSFPLPYDTFIALGDGTTALFLKDPGGNKIEITTVVL